MPIQNRIDCPALRKRSNIYPFGERVPRTVRMLKTVTADPMPGVGLAYIKGDMPVATAGQSYPVWTNSHGAVAAVMPDGRHLGLRPQSSRLIPGTTFLLLQQALASPWPPPAPTACTWPGR